MGILSNTNSNQAGAVSKEEGERLSWDEIIPGTELARTTYELDAPLITKYIKAVSRDGTAPEYVPPMAIAAYAMAALARSLALPPGTIHAGQELEFLKAVPLGSAVTCQGRVAQKLERGKLRMLTIDIAAAERGDTVLIGRSTLILPG